MKTNKLIAKEFALMQIAPYYKDPSTCGFKNGKCLYLTEDGKMCVVGKNMLEPEKWAGDILGILTILSSNKGLQKGIFKPEVIDILSAKQWTDLQSIHDMIALGFDDEDLLVSISQLNLFTFEELQEAVEKLN